MKADSPLVDRITPSPNFGDRRGRVIDALILHYTGMPTGALARERLTDPSSEVSCHYLVWEDGRIEQLVAESSRAWHAGRGVWAGEHDMNSVSIGIEIVNGGHDGGCPPYPDAQIERLALLMRDVCSRHMIVSRRILAHSDVAPDRKEDPGEWFPWARLAREGLGLWVAAPPPGAPLEDANVQEIQKDLGKLGYDCPQHGHSDAATKAVIRAFQRRYRPVQVDGLIDRSTAETLTKLLELRP